MVEWMIKKFLTEIAGDTEESMPLCGEKTTVKGYVFL